MLLVGFSKYVPLHSGTETFRSAEEDDPRYPHGDERYWYNDESLRLHNGFLLSPQDGESDVVVLDDLRDLSGHGHNVAETIVNNGELESDDIIFRHSRTAAREFEPLPTAASSQYAPGSLEYQIEQTAVRNFRPLIQDIDAVVQLKQREYRDIKAINASFGFSKSSIYGEWMSKQYDSMDPRTVMGIAEKVLKDSTAVKSIFTDLDKSVDAAKAAGIHVVFAAGNEGDDSRSFRSNFEQELGVKFSESDQLSYVVSDGVFLVGASNPHGTLTSPFDDTLAPFSSSGSNTGEHPDIVAPGVDLPTTLGFFSGTSAAAPYTVATMIDMAQANPNLTVDEIENIVTKTALDHPKVDVAHEGAGTLNRDAAMFFATQSKGMSRADLNLLLDAYKVLSTENKRSLPLADKALQRTLTSVLGDQTYKDSAASNKTIALRHILEYAARGEHGYTNGNRSEQDRYILLTEKLFNDILKPDVLAREEGEANTKLLNGDTTWGWWDDGLITDLANDHD